MYSFLLVLRSIIFGVSAIDVAQVVPAVWGVNVHIKVNLSRVVSRKKVSDSFLNLLMCLLCKFYYCPPNAFCTPASKSLWMLYFKVQGLLL